MRTRLLAVLTGLLVFALVAPASADHIAFHPTTRTEQVFFHCASPVKLSNVALLTGAPSWDTNAPTGSVQDGAGCGYVAPGAAKGANPRTFYDAPFEGSHKGNLRSLTVNAHSLLASRARTGAASINVWLLVDDVDMYKGFFELPVVESNSGATEEFVFTIDGLPFMTEHGNGTMERKVTLTLSAHFSNHVHTVAYDTTEVPSGITFNPVAPASKVVTATPAS